MVERQVLGYLKPELCPARTKPLVGRIFLLITQFPFLALISYIKCRGRLARFRAVQISGLFERQCGVWL
jgi:hypothetical protein